MNSRFQFLCRSTAAIATVVTLSACTRGAEEVSATVLNAPTAAPGTIPAAGAETNTQPSDGTVPGTAPTTVRAFTVASTTVPPSPSTTVPPSPPSSTALSVTETTDPPSASTDGSQVQGIAVPELGSGSTPYRVPTDSPDRASWGDTHHDYPATDIFVPGTNGCGGPVTSPVNGIIVEVRRDNDYDRAIDNPATRGGRSITIVGDDGVRYYMSHLDAVDTELNAGDRIAVGDHLGTVGQTGRAGACHIHLGISPACADREWSVRRGVIWPYSYLDDWKSGGQLSPVDEVATFLSEHPDACAEAADDPSASDA